MIFWGIVQLNITRQVYIVVWLLKLKMLFPGFWLHARRDGQLLHSGFPSWILGGLLLSHPLKLEDLRTNTVFIIIVPSPQCTFCFLFSPFSLLLTQIFFASSAPFAYSSFLPSKLVEQWQGFGFPISLERNSYLLLQWECIWTLRPLPNTPFQIGLGRPR